MNIFVARMSYDTTEDTVMNLFSQHGTVDSVKIIFDRERGSSKGFGFVEMPNDDEGRAAIEALNGLEVDGREIVVKKAEPRGGGGGGRDRNDRGRRREW